MVRPLLCWFSDWKEHIFLVAYFIHTYWRSRLEATLARSLGYTGANKETRLTTMLFLKSQSPQAIHLLLSSFEFSYVCLIYFVHSHNREHLECTILARTRGLLCA